MTATEDNGGYIPPRTPHTFLRCHQRESMHNVVCLGAHRFAILKGTNETTLSVAYGTLHYTYNSDAPTTKAAASQLAAQANRTVQLLNEWVNDLTDTIDSATQAADGPR